MTGEMPDPSDRLDAALTQGQRAMAIELPDAAGTQALVRMARKRRAALSRRLGADLDYRRPLGRAHRLHRRAERRLGAVARSLQFAILRLQILRVLRAIWKPLLFIAAFLAVAGLLLAYWPVIWQQVLRLWAVVQP